MNNYKVGDTVRIFDTFDNAWFDAKVISIDGKMCTVAYEANGWQSKWTGDQSQLKPSGEAAVSEDASTSSSTPATTSTSGGASTSSSTPATTSASGAGIKVGSVVYYLDFLGKWRKGVVDSEWTPGTWLIGTAGPKDEDELISEEEARRRGVHEDSTTADRKVFVQAMYENLNVISSGNLLADLIVAEHNRIRRDPSAYAKELTEARDALIKSRTEGVGNPDPIDITKKAIDTCIADLNALGALPPIRQSKAGTKFAQWAADNMTGHCQISQIINGWSKEGFADGGTYAAESYGGVDNSSENLAEKARLTVLAFLVDWGVGNANSYGHRANILDGQTASVSRQAKPYCYLGVGVNSKGTLYMQYHSAKSYRVFLDKLITA